MVKEKCCATCVYADFPMTAHKPPRIKQNAATKCNWNGADSLVFPQSIRGALSTTHVAAEMGKDCRAYVPRETSRGYRCRQVYEVIVERPGPNQPLDRMIYDLGPNGISGGLKIEIQGPVRNWTSSQEFLGFVAMVGAKGYQPRRITAGSALVWLIERDGVRIVQDADDMYFISENGKRISDRFDTKLAALMDAISKEAE